MGKRKYEYYLITHSNEHFVNRRDAEREMASHGRTTEYLYGKRISDGELVELKSKY